MRVGLALSTLAHGIDAPGAGAGKDQIEKDKAEQDRRIAEIRLQLQWQV